MKMVKSLLLASAAGLAVTAGAQAADLPVKAKPVEYVKVCSLYGAGFFYLPGTDTCLKIGGYMLFESTIHGTGTHSTRLNGNDALDTHAQDWTFMRGRADVSFDVRTQTEYGTLRGFTLLDVLNSTNNGDYGTGVVNTSVGPLALGFIQFAGFTMGKAIPMTEPSFGAPIWTTVALFGRSDVGSGLIGMPQIKYTADFGNGVTLDVGFQDSSWNRNPYYDASNAIASTFASPPGSFPSSSGGQKMPDFIANFQVNQAWGGFSLAGILRDMTTTYYQVVDGGTAGANSTTILQANGSPSEKLGWAVMAALQLKNLPTGAGDQIQVYGGVSQGIVQAFHTQTPDPNQIGVTQMGGTPGVNQSIGWGPVVDAVFAAPGTPAGLASGTAGNLNLTTAYGAAGGFEHYWVPGRWRSSVFGGFESIRYNSEAKAQLCYAAGRARTAGGVGLAGGTNCNFDLNFYVAGLRTVWTPVSGLDLIVEGVYTRIDPQLTGTINPPTGNYKTPGVYQIGGQNDFSGYFRAIRTF